MFFMALLFLAFIFYGFESAADVVEEVIDSRRRVPKVMIWALEWGGYHHVCCLCVFARHPQYALGYDFRQNTESSLTATIGITAAKIFLWIVIIAFLSCGAAVEAAATRVFFSYARGGAIPFSTFLSHASAKYDTPVNALWLSGVVALLISLSAKFESILTSFAVMGIYLAFQLIMLVALIARIRGMKADGLFNLRGWVWLINLLAMGYGVAMIMNLVRPSHPTAPWYINYEVFLATAAIILSGTVVYFTAPRMEDLHLDERRVAKR